MLFFLCGRCFFLLYHIKPISKLPITETLKSFVYGLTLDISFASYITILIAALLPLLLVFKLNEKIVRNSILIYTSIWIILLAFAYTLDAELFSFWGFRLDNTLFRYTGTPAEMIGSAMSSPLWLLLPFFFIAAYIGFKIFKKYYFTFPFIHLKLWQVPIALFVAALLVIPIRGGLQQIPNNESVAYYSTIPILNQAALNPAWTLARSVIEQNGPDPERYRLIKSGDEDRIVRQRLIASALDSIPLTSTRPNIILIVWESLTAKVLNDTVTPGLNTLKNSGIYFSSMYASGDRSDKGLVALLSAYPAQPDYSIMTEPGKSRKLPFITQQLKGAGYNTGYIYGGELEFANMRSYMNYNGFDEIQGKFDFPEESWGAKWGAHDQFTFDRLLERANLQSKKANPFFYTLFTLSSHEPFDVPGRRVLAGSSKTIQFKNAHHYTDSCFADFIHKAQQQAWWNNTWIIVIGDHGHVLPGNEYANHTPDEFKIPMVWLGGAINQKRLVANTHSQIELAPSIAAYLGLKPAAFTFSKPINITDTTQYPAWYSFNDGFASVYNNKRFFMYGLNNQQITQQKKGITKQDITYAEAFLQVLMEDFYKK
ncbi:LTA synthase family protein [Cytophaga aurantiaca]|uniref:LTA synthase family protein n=1 Tax=Cytophaga aurantiaca TaxID=29530 RepID=UPI000370E62F|nr:LTA synthase family protein [Cytophaga aurantiaca]